MSFQEYLDQFQLILNELLALGDAQIIEFQADARSLSKGYIRGILEFNNGSQLHFREFLDTAQAEPRLMYAYHYQNRNGSLIFRYDNAAHRPALSRAEHRHSSEGVMISGAPTLQEVLDEIDPYLEQPFKGL